MSNTAMKQESFHISEEARKRVIRQDRVPVPPKKCCLVFENLRIEIINISNFGVGTLVLTQQLNDLKNIFDKDELQDCVIFFNTSEIQKVRVKLIRLERHPDSTFNDYIAGFDVVGDSISIGLIKAMIQADDSITEHRIYFAEEQQIIPADFKLMVYEMRDWLSSLKERVDKLEENAPIDNADENSEYREAVAQKIAAYVGQVIPESYLNIPKMIAGKDSATISACTKFIRHQIGELIYGAPFAYRA
ncbi:MAG: hypothetical protein ACXVAJ_08600, partial [Parachlamydiaceae bacterium]